MPSQTFCILRINISTRAKETCVYVVMPIGTNRVIQKKMEQL